MKKIKRYRCKKQLGKYISKKDIFTECVQGYESASGILLPKDVVEESPDVFEEAVDEIMEEGWYVGRLIQEEGDTPWAKALFFFDGQKFINRYGNTVERIYFAELTKKPLDLNNIGDW